MILLHEKANDSAVGFCQVFRRWTIEGGFFRLEGPPDLVYLISESRGFWVPGPLGEIMIDAIVAWDAEDDPDGNGSAYF